MSYSRLNGSSSAPRCYGSFSTFNLGMISFSFTCGIIISILNLIVLCAIYKNPRRNLRTPSSLLIANLVTSDLITGLVYCNVAGASSLLRGFGDCDSLSKASNTFRALVLFVNNFTITSMSFDRLIAVSKPLSYKNLVTNTRVLILIAAIWVLASVLCIPVAGISEESEDIFEKYIYPHSHISLPLVLLTTTYICIFRKLKRQRDLLHREDESAHQRVINIQKTKRLDRERRMTWTIILVMAFFWIAALPYFISLNILTTSTKGNRDVRNLWMFSARFVMINCAIDPILLTTRLPNIRDAVRIFLRMRGSRAVGPSSMRSVTITDD